jgi:hypothetical protein
MADTIECDHGQVLTGGFFEKHELKTRPRLHGSDVGLCETEETREVVDRAAAHLLGGHIVKSG